MNKFFIPAGQSGKWKVEQFSVSERGSTIDRIRALSGLGRCVPVGEYTRLMRGGTVIMSDTPDELRDLSGFKWAVRGRVLINGLGLGIAVRMALRKMEVSSVTVIEQSEDVIALVSPHIADPRLQVIHADALEYRPNVGERFDCVWHDIWDYICPDNLSEMTALHRRYGRRTDWQDSWCRDQCRRLAA